MTRNQLFMALAGGATVLAVISAGLTSSDHADDHDGFLVIAGGDRVSVSGDDIEIESRGDSIVVHTKDGTINCTKNGGTVVIEREDGTKTEISCD